MNAKILSAILKHLKNNSREEGFDPHKYRTFLEESAKKCKIDKNIAFERFNIGNIPAAWLVPQDAASGKVLFYLHGGGFIAGSINSHRDLVSRIAKAARQKVLMIDYRLAPENPFPAGLNDAFEVYKWLLEHQYSHKNIALAGDSAGGNLVLSLLLKLKAYGIRMPSAAVLISPWLHLECRHGHDTYKENAGKDPMLSKKALYYTALLYAGSQQEHQGNRSDELKPLPLRHPLISPLNGDMSGLPPMFIQAGSHEILMGDAVALARKAEQAGVTVNLDIWDGMFHVWHYFARYLKEGREAIEIIGAWLEKNSEKAGKKN